MARLAAFLLAVLFSATPLQAADDIGELAAWVFANGEDGGDYAYMAEVFGLDDGELRFSREVLNDQGRERLILVRGEEGAGRFDIVLADMNGMSGTLFHATEDDGLEQAVYLDGGLIIQRFEPDTMAFFFARQIGLWYNWAAARDSHDS